MPTKKGPSRIYKLPRLLDNSPDLIAVISEQFDVVYANQACCDWLGVASEDLIGTRVDYSSASNKPGERFNGICPPPSLFSTELENQTSQIHVVRDGKRVSRIATFSRVSTEDELHCAVIVIASGDDSPELSEHPSDSNLHQILAQLHQDEKSLFHAESLVGTSDRALRIRRQVAAASSNNADCLIVGPAGSGREHIAKTIFYQRNLANAQLVPVHCAIADGELIQNAIKNWVFDRRSNQSADWLLLLDVDRLGIDAQSELLGYTRIPDFQMPIVATASNDLISMASQGQFSGSLAMHLSVQSIRLDALTSRIKDLPLLVQAFIEQVNKKAVNQIAGVSDEVLSTLTEYHWPRNIAELKQYIEAAHEACHGSTIQMKHLPEEFSHALAASRIGYYELQPIMLTEYLEEIEKELITRALAQSGNNKTKAAQLLGISRARLLRRSNSLEVQGPQTEDDGLVDESEFKDAE